MPSRNRDRSPARRTALLAAAVIAVAACGDDGDAADGDAADGDQPDASTAAPQPATDDDAPDAAPTSPGVLVEPAGVTAFDDLLTVSPTGSLVYEIGDELCVFETPSGSQEFCAAAGLGGEVAGDATWHPSGDRVAFNVGAAQVVVLDLAAEAATIAGVMGDAEVAVTSPFVLDGEYGFVRSENDELALAGADGDLLVAGWATDPEAADDRPLVLTTAGEQYSYTAVGDPIGLRRLDDSLALESADLIETVGDITLAAKRSTSNDTALFHSVTSDWSVLTWHLVAADGVTLVPFSGTDAAPAPDGSDAVGMSGEEPGKLLRWDSTEDSVEPIAEFDEPIDEVFWPEPGTVVVRIGASVHLVAV